MISSLLKYKKSTVEKIYYTQEIEMLHYDIHQSIHVVHVHQHQSLNIIQKDFASTSSTLSATVLDIFGIRVETSLVLARVCALGNMEEEL